MGFITRQILLGIECDKRDCGAEIEASAGPFWTVRDDLIAEAVAEGWRCFVGRSQRWYCPDHGPAPVSGPYRKPMRLIYGAGEDSTR